MLLFSYKFATTANKLSFEALENLLGGQREDITPWQIFLLTSLSPVIASIAT
jgi:hypothetical protein